MNIGEIEDNQYQIQISMWQAQEKTWSKCSIPSNLYHYNKISKFKLNYSWSKTKILVISGFHLLYMYLQRYKQQKNLINISYKSIRLYLKKKIPDF